MRLTELDISAAAYACLQAVGITSIEDFKQYPCDELLSRPHFGALELYEIIRQLNEHDLTLPAVPGGRMRLPSTPKHELVRLRMIDGLTFAEIGQHVGLTRERVRQVLRANYGLRVRPPAVGARRRRETIEQIWAS
jgi:Bacterial RNA polymerase, alpha chain C terminal domain/Sigma-70, region 4